MAKADSVAQAKDYAPVLRKAADLVPYARNSRTHSDAQVAKIAASLVEFGFTNPVLIDDKGIIAGHGRVLAALKLYEAGRTIKTPSGAEIAAGYVPTLDCTGWSDAQRKAYIIADNAIAEQSGWDVELLKIEIGELESLNFNVDLLGFDPGDLSEMLFPDAGEHDNDPTEPPDDGYAEQYGCVVVCNDAAHQQQVYEALTEQGYNVKVVVT